MDVVTLGESMVVFLPEAEGPLRHVARFGRGVAGAESNVAIGLCRLGHPTAWIGRVGEDEFGRYILDTLATEGLDLRFASADPGAPTGIMFKERRPGADSRVVYYRAGSAASRLDAGDVPEAVFAGAAWLHVTGITAALGDGPRRAVARALELAARFGLRVSFDPNYRARLWSEEQARPVLRDLASQCDLLLLGTAEGRLLYGSDDPEEIARAGLRAGPTLVAVKRGSEGALLAGNEGRWAIPPHPVSIVEPTGAGDAFAAGCIAALLDGQPPLACGRLGALCGALVCTVAGDWEGAPDRETAASLLGR